MQYAAAKDTMTIVTNKHNIKSQHNFFSHKKSSQECPASFHSLAPRVWWLKWPWLTLVPGLIHDTVACGIIADVYGTECTLAAGSAQDMRILGLREGKKRDNKRMCSSQCERCHQSTSTASKQTLITLTRLITGSGSQQKLWGRPSDEQWTST